MTAAQSQLLADLRSLLAGLAMASDREASVIRRAMGEIRRLADELEEAEREWQKSCDDYDNLIADLDRRTH